MGKGCLCWCNDLVGLGFSCLLGGLLLGECVVLLR